MADKYSNFADLQQTEKTDNYSITVKKESKFIAIIAPHAGKIEPGTTEIATKIAGNDYSLYTFNGKKATKNQELHITSTCFDEPQCLDLVKEVHYVLAIHGKADDQNNNKEKQIVFVGGKFCSFYPWLKAELEANGFNVRQSEDPRLSGQHSDNICNKGQRGYGMQLEITRSLRDFLLKDDNAMNKFCYAVRNALAKIAL